MFLLLAIPFVILGVINLTQVVLGRQLIRPDRSTRPRAQLRRESALAAVEMLGFVGTMFGLQFDSGLLIALGLVVGLGAYAVLYLGRRRKPVEDSAV